MGMDNNHITETGRFFRKRQSGLLSNRHDLNLPQGSMESTPYIKGTHPHESSQRCQCFGFNRIFSRITPLSYSPDTLLTPTKTTNIFHKISTSQKPASLINPNNLLKQQQHLKTRSQTNIMLLIQIIVAAGNISYGKGCPREVPITERDRPCKVILFQSQRDGSALFSGK